MNEIQTNAAKIVSNPTLTECFLTIHSFIIVQRCSNFIVNVLFGLQPYKVFVWVLFKSSLCLLFLKLQSVLIYMKDSMFGSAYVSALVLGNRPQPMGVSEMYLL